MHENCKNLLLIRDRTHQTPPKIATLHSELDPLIYFHVPALQLWSKDGRPNGGEKPNPNPSSRPQALSTRRRRKGYGRRASRDRSRVGCVRLPGESEEEDGQAEALDCRHCAARCREDKGGGGRPSICDACKRFRDFEPFLPPPPHPPSLSLSELRNVFVF